MATWVGVEATRRAWAANAQSASQRLMLLAIAKYADENCKAFPSVDSLCADTCLNKKTAFKVLKELKEAGVLSVAKRSTNNSNEYTILADCGCTKTGSTKNGTTENGTTVIGTPVVPKTVQPVVPKTVHEENKEERKEENTHSSPAFADDIPPMDSVPCEGENIGMDAVDDFSVSSEPLESLEATEAKAPWDDADAFSLTAEASAAPVAEKPSPKRPFASKVPVSKVVELYNRILGDYLPRALKITPARAQAIKARWADIMHDAECTSEKECLDNWEGYFTFVLKNNFLMNGTKGLGHDNWRADFDFLMKQKTYLGILERKYR